MKTNKSSKTKTIIIVILIILLAISLCYIMYQKQNNKESQKENKVQEQIESQTILTEGNNVDLNGIPCVSETSTCTKKIGVSYNNKNHSIKIKYQLTKNENNEDEYVNYYDGKYYLYIDNKLVDTLDGGTTELQKNQDPNNVEFDGKIYIFNGKYLGFLRSEVTLLESKGYNLTIYNNDKKINDDVTIKVAGQSLYNKEKEINVIEELDFDGETLYYYQGDCDLQKIVLYSLTTDGNKITKDITKRTNLDIKQSTKGVTACYSSKENKIKE